MSDPLIQITITGRDDFGGFDVVRVIRHTRTLDEIRSDLVDAVEAWMDSMALHRAQVDAWCEKGAGRADPEPVIRSDPSWGKPGKPHPIVTSPLAKARDDDFERKSGTFMGRHA